jgi:HNH endonuclease
MTRYGLPLEIRLWARVDKTDDCWNWTGNLQSSGYGVITENRKSYVVHRLTYTWVKGPIPVGLEIDHLCRNKRCVRPDHLEAVTHGENVRRAKVYKCQDPSHHRSDDGKRCIECTRAVRRAYMREWNRKRRAKL